MDNSRMEHDAGTRHDARLTRARAVARALDSAVGIPGTSLRFGLDPILGLVPGVGDLVGAGLSAYIVLTGLQVGVSRATVIRMLLNIGTDALVGSVPVLGDLFDAGWKANNRNMALIEQHVATPGAARTSSRATIGGVILALVLLAAASITLTVAIVRLLIGLVNG